MEGVRLWAHVGRFAAGEALRAAEGRYRDLFDNAASGIVHVRADGTFLEVNRTWAAVLGYDTPAQYVSEVGNAGNIWDDPDQRASFLRAVADHGVVRGFEARFRHRNGGVVWISLHARAVRDGAGELVELHTSGLDITDHKLAEQSLRESEARFRSIFVHNLDGILLAASDGQIISANPAACQILHRTEAELQALGHEALFEIGDARLAAAMAPRVAGAPAHAEITMTRPGGITFPAEITCSSFTDAGGVANLAMIIRDVSERRHAEQELRRAKQGAEAASQAKDEFLSRMSHELRTPLNAMLGFAQLLEMDLPADQQDSVQHIRRAGRHLLDLINEVLDITAIESGHLALSPETVRVSDLIGETVKLMGPLAAANGVRLEATPAHLCVCHVRADRQRAKQVILNLLSNAVKYNKPGGTVRVRCRAVGDANAAIEVEDNGIGIGADDLDRLFVPFERLGATTTDVEGTGVGLALSQRLAAAMDGTITVMSEVGQGSTFTFTLPVAPDLLAGHREAGESSRADLAAGETPAAPPGAGPVHTVLSIEDNLANTRLLQQIVARRPGWQIVTAGHGQLGLDLATADPPELVLLDLHLPDMPGLQVLRRLKATQATQHIPVVVVSADATPGQVKRLHANGAAAYLTKPINVEEILDLLDQTADSDAEVHQ